MRIDNAQISVIIKPNINMASADNLSLSAKEQSVKSMEYSGADNRPLKQTIVEKGLKTLEKELDKLAIDVQAEEIKKLKKEIAALTNTLSAKDCAAMQEKGWSLNETEIKTIVTVVDKIKMELIKAGADVDHLESFLSKAQIEAMGASEAAQIEQALRKADLPYTQENKEDFESSLEQAGHLKPCDAGTKKYLLINKMEPTIANLYKAQHCASHEEDVKAPELDDGIKKQLEARIASAGLTVDDAAMAYGSFLIGNDIPVTEENLKYIDALTNLKLPIDPSEVLEKMTSAVIEGRRPQDAVLIEEYSLQHKAQEVKAVVDQAEEEDLAYLIRKHRPFTINNLKEAHLNDRNEVKAFAAFAKDEMQVSFVTARRQLEEIRLSMTAEANYKLLKQGVSIETQPIEELIDQLKSIEDDYYKSLLSRNEMDASKENITLLKDSLEKTESIKQVPAYVLGTNQDKAATIAILHENGCQLKASLEKAGQAYETLMTAPRSDMGDTIQKAFQNVDDILVDLNMEASAANQRAVRILAYNGLEITRDSITQMKAADQRVQLLFDNLTPSVVMELMKKDINPLNMDVTELNQMAEAIKAELNINEEEKFSKYLWKLEQKNEISKEERAGFIGMYRMLHQVQQSDGAVIGALVHQGADITIKNLMTAVRSKKAAGLDVKMDDSTLLSSDFTKSELSITEQIETAYQSDCAKEAYHRVTPDATGQVMAENNWEELTPEQLLWKLKETQNTTEHEKEYLNHQMNEFIKLKDVESSVLQMLTKYEMPVTAYNILAANKMINKRSQVFNQLFNSDISPEELDLDEIKQKIFKDFAEAVKTPEDMAKAQEALADTAENVMKRMMESENVESLDIRNLKILRQEIAISTEMSKEENYAIPVLISGEAANVSLKIVRGTRDKGKVDIFFETSGLSKVSAQIKITENKVTGIIASDLQDSLDLIKDKEREFADILALNGTYDVELNYIKSDSLLPAYTAEGKEDLAEHDAHTENDEYKIQTKTLYGVSKSFLAILMKL